MLSLVFVSCKNDTKIPSQAILLKKMENEIRVESTDKKAIQLFDKLIQLNAAMEKAEIRVLGFKHRELPIDKKEGSKKLLRQDHEWNNFNKQRVIYKSRLEKHLTANYPEYAKKASRKKQMDNSIPLKVQKEKAINKDLD